MSWISASVAPSGRHLASRLSPTDSSAFIWSAQPGRERAPDSLIVMSPRGCVAGAGVGRSGFERDVEVADVEVVVGAQLGRAETELLGGVVVRPVCSRPVGLLPVAQRLLDR